MISSTPRNHRPHSITKITVLTAWHLIAQRNHSYHIIKQITVQTLRGEPQMSEKPAIVKEQYLHSELTGKIIGCAMEVHRCLGNGFQEVIYQRALAIEMGVQGLTFEREKEMDIFYRGERIGTRRVDFFVEGCIMVELKAVIQLEDVHLAQAINYLEAYKMEIGLLINFGARSLQFKRVHNNKFIQKNQAPSENHGHQANHKNQG
jgi:GxxExxY protein